MSLVVRQCTVSLGGTKVLDSVDAEIGTGEWLGVLGPNGAGKSTMARAVLGLVNFDGAVIVMGHDAARAKKRQWARLVAYVPQRPVLPPAMTVADYVLLGRAVHHSYLSAENRADRHAAGWALERLELSALAGRALGTLSGGEAQRVVLARALAQEAPVLVLDEPTSAMDLGHSQMVLELAEQLRREQGLTVLCTLHDLTLAGQYSDRLMLLSGGRAVACGRPEEVLTVDNIDRFFSASVEVLGRPSGPVVAPRKRPAGDGAGSAAPVGNIQLCSSPDIEKRTE